MKPINAEEEGCNYTSSNCVVWQGPDLPCIKLCKGDKVSDVIFKLATELCEVINALDISAYDLSCFDLTSCAPKDFQALIQFIMDRLCALEKCADCVPGCDTKGTSPSTTSTTSSVGCPDCLVQIAPCFYYTNSVGDTVQLQDYVTAIGNKLCSLASTISIQQQAINNLNIRVTNLENAVDPVYVPPTVTPQCVLPSIPTQMDVLLAALETSFCQLQTATGAPLELYQNIAKQCAGLNSQLQLNGSGGTMASLPGWAPVVNNMAQSMGNMWLTICDMRAAIRNIQLNCCPSGCDGINLNMIAIQSGDVLSIYVGGTIPPEFVECGGSTLITLTDSAGGSLTVPFNLITYLNNPSGFPISLLSTPINPTLNITVVIQPCLRNTTTETRCESYLTYLVVNSPLCPSVSFVTTSESIEYSFLTPVGNYTYTIELWNSTNTILLSTQVVPSTGIGTLTGTFVLLTPSTTYHIRVKVQATACPECEPTVCPFSIVTTNVQSCIPPEDVTAEITED